MNLSDIASYVTTKAQLLEADDVLACKQFVSKRYELLWNQYLWKDSLVMLNVSVDPTTNADHAEGIVLMPEEVDRVVALRSTNQQIRIQGLEYFYQTDFDKFSATGSACEFAILNPIWFVWRGGLGLKLVCEATDTAGVPCKVAWRGTDGIRHVQNLTALADGSGVLNSDPEGKTTDTNVVVVSGATNSAWNGNYVKTGTLNGHPIYGNYYTVGAFAFVYYPAYGGWVFNFTQVVVAGVVSGSIILVPYPQSGTTDLPLPGTWTDVTQIPTIYATVAFITESRIEVESVFKAVTNGSLSLNPQITGEDAGGTLSKTDTASPSYQRVRLFDIPTAAVTLNVLAKKKFVPLDFDQQVPAIRNLDNCLIAFAMSDLLLRERQYAKAQQQLQEGTVLLKELALVETMQAAHHSVIEPSGGFGDIQRNNNGRVYY